MANLGKWQITNRTYEDLETIINDTLTVGTVYLIQVEGSFYMCRKDTTPDENEGFHYRETEKTFLYTHGNTTYYFKKDVLTSNVTINIDEQES